MISYRLKDLIEIHNGKKYDHLNGGLIPVYGSGGVMCFVDEYLYDGEAVLLPRKGTLSNIMYTDGKIWTVDTMYYATTSTLALPYYIYCYLSLLNLGHLDSGSTLPSMTKASYNEIEVKLPNLRVQGSVVNAISTIDKKIELNNKINTELEAMAKLIYDYWFVQFDFPDANGKPYKSSGGKMVYNEVLKREIPEGWKVDNINNIIDVKDGTHDSPKPTEQGYHLITSKNLKVEGLDFENANIISKEDYESINRRSEVETGDILFSMIGSIGVIYKVDEENISFAIKNVALYKTSQKEAYRNYIYTFLKSYDMQRYMGNVISGSIQKFIGLGSLRSMPLLLDDATITEFESTTEHIFKKKTLIKQENQKLAELRDWLLPMLMNGQVTVNT